jgi:glycosyltransferase involved in cell wall biosynthesis
VKHLVSILIPAYNAEPWIAETIRSALKQTWAHKEIIVVDDGSRDATLAVAKRLESATVKVVTQDNGGACAARNRALAIAQGDYIQWLDADDLLEAGKIQRQMERQAVDQDPRVLLTSAWGKFYFRTQRAAFRPDGLWQNLDPVEWLVTKFERGVWMNPGAWLVSRELTERAGPWDDRLAFSGDDDGEYMCRLVAQSSRVAFVPEARAFYRIGNAGLSWRKSDKALESFYLATALSIEHLLALERSPRTKAAAVQFLQARLRYVHKVQPALGVKLGELAAAIGGTLSPPRASRQFRAVETIIGFERASRLKGWLWATDIKWRRGFDRALDAVLSAGYRSQNRYPEREIGI